MDGVGCPLHLPAKEWPQLWETDEHLMPISHSNQYKSQSFDDIKWSTPVVFNARSLGE